MYIKVVNHEDGIELTKLQKYIEEKETGMDSYISFIDLSFENDPNQINYCITDTDNNEIYNASFFKGAKDTGLVELEVIDLTNKEFIKQSVDFAFHMLNAKTISVFSQKPNKNIESLGFESLGDYNGKTAYILEQTKEKESGRRK